MIFSILISLPFLEIDSVHSLTGSAIANHISARKDVFYRLKNSSNICWRLILWMFSMKFTKLVISQASTDADTPKCLIFDDSMIEKTGRYIENVSRMFDHVTKRFVLGFKLLTMGYWDGTSFIPLDFSLHREGKVAIKTSLMV